MAPEWTAQDGQVLGPLPPTCKTQGSSWNLALAVVAIWGVIMGERYIPFSFSLCLSNTICEKSLNMITYHQKYSSFSFSSTYLEDKGWKNKIILYSFFQRSIFTWEAEWQREEKRDQDRPRRGLLSTVSFPKWLQQPGLEPETPSGLPCVQQETNLLGHILLLSQVC